MKYCPEYGESFSKAGERPGFRCTSTHPTDCFCVCRNKAKLAISLLMIPVIGAMYLRMLLVLTMGQDFSKKLSPWGSSAQAS